MQSMRSTEQARAGAAPYPARPSAGEPRDFEFTRGDFEKVRELVKRHTGIALSDAKRQMVYGRLARRMRQLGVSRTADYLRMLDDVTGQELEHFRNAVTTNLTAFFREQHHFQLLAQRLKDDAALRERKRLNIWSAGSSTGEEAYSIAITLRETLADIDDWDIRILATDIDSQVVETGRKGIYTQDRVQGLPEARLRRWFQRGKGRQQGLVRVSPLLRDMVSFKPLNLMHAWPRFEPFDFIFCRNVAIYFDHDTKVRLFGRMAEVLRPDGFLMIGHSENLSGVSSDFRLISNTTYVKTDSAPGGTLNQHIQRAMFFSGSSLSSKEHQA
ncbi:MAG: CheR family methyltransferase [Gammaproteobacteria bacterium]